MNHPHLVSSAKVQQSEFISDFNILTLLYF